MARKPAFWIVLALTAAVLGIGLFAMAGPAESGEELGMVLSSGEEGALVLAVMEDSAADRAGVEPGDVLVSLDGRRPTPEDVRDSCFRRLERGIPLVLEREGVRIYRTLGR